MRHKPVLFLDFDRTLFDTERFYEWLGDDRYANILALMAGRIPAPEFSNFLYDDTKVFLEKTRKEYRLVLLTYAVNTLLQRKKVRGSGVVPLLDDVVITTQDKGVSAKEYLARIGDPGWEHTFVDDAPENIIEMKKTIPDMRVVRIERKPLPEDKKSILKDADAEIVVTTLTELLPHLL